MENSKEKTRLWIVTELYYPELTSTGYYLTKIAEGLADDFDIRVICGQPNYSARGTKAPRRETLNGVEISRVFGTRLNKNVILFRVVNMVTLGVSVFLKSVFGFRTGDLVMVVTTPPLMPFLTSAVCRMRRSKHVLLIHDCYPEILYAANKLKPGSLLARVLEQLSRKLLVSADRLIVVGRDMQKRIAEKTGGRIKSDVVPNWAELEAVSPAAREDNPLLNELGLDGKLIFQYAGNMGYPNDIESFINVAKTLAIDLPAVHFVFIGSGVKKSLLESVVKTKKYNNITLLDSRPRSDQQVFLNACDVGIVSLVSKMWGVSMPSRTYNILAAGKPVLAVCEPDSEIALVVEEEQVGWIVEPGNEDALAKTIHRIYNTRSEIPAKGANARSAAKRKYSLKTALDKYRRALED